MSSERYPLAERTLVSSGGSRGISDLSRYGGGDDPRWDIFVDES